MDARIWFLLHIFRMNGQNSTKFCIHIIIDKIFVGILKGHYFFLQICNRVTTLDWIQNLVNHGLQSWLPLTNWKNLLLTRELFKNTCLFSGERSLAFGLLVFLCCCYIWPSAQCRCYILPSWTAIIIWNSFQKRFPDAICSLQRSCILCTSSNIATTKVKKYNFKTSKKWPLKPTYIVPLVYAYCKNWTD